MAPQHVTRSIQIPLGACARHDPRSSSRLLNGAAYRIAEHESGGDRAGDSSGFSRCGRNRCGGAPASPSTRRPAGRLAGGPRSAWPPRRKRQRAFIGGAGAMPSQETLLLARLADHATALQRPALETNGNTSIESAIRTKIIPRGHRTYVLGVGSQRPKGCSRVSTPGHGDEQKELTCAPIE